MSTINLEINGSEIVAEEGLTILEVARRADITIPTLCSVGEKNRFGFPDRVVLDRYRKIGAEVYRTDHHGAVEIVSDGSALSVRMTMDENR